MQILMYYFETMKETLHFVLVKLASCLKHGIAILDNLHEEVPAAPLVSGY